MHQTAATQANRTLCSTIPSSAPRPPAPTALAPGSSHPSPARCSLGAFPDPFPGLARPRPRPARRARVPAPSGVQGSGCGRRLVWRSLLTVRSRQPNTQQQLGSGGPAPGRWTTVWTRAARRGSPCRRGLLGARRGPGQLEGAAARGAQTVMAAGRGAPQVLHWLLEPHWVLFLLGGGLILFWTDTMLST